MIVRLILTCKHFLNDKYRWNFLSKKWKVHFQIKKCLHNTEKLKGCNVAFSSQMHMVYGYWKVTRKTI